MSAQATVFGVILNDHRSMQRLQAQFTAAPYLTPPRAPVLHIKPSNTLAGEGAVVVLPSGAEQLEIGASLGLVIGRLSSHLSLENALAAVSAYVIMADLSLPHAQYYRPAIRERCFDGACPISPKIAFSPDLPQPEQLSIRSYVNGQLVETRNLADLVRSASELLRDVTEFMRLDSNDILHLGVLFQGAQARVGDAVRIVIDHLGELNFTLVASCEEQI